MHRIYKESDKHMDVLIIIKYERKFNVTPAQAIKISQEYGEAFLPVPGGISQTVMNNRLNQAARCAGLKFLVSYWLMVW